MAGADRVWRVIGMMSGTSLDGVDAALVEFSAGAADVPAWRLLAFVTLPYSPERREAIHEAILSGGAADLCRLHVKLGEWFGEAALDVCGAAGLSGSDVDLIGSHGQTVWHEPPASGRRGSSLQLGCAATIVEMTGIPVVSDFRARDLAAGGQGAPLVPWADHLLFAVPGRRRALQNIGGMANVTWLAGREECVPPVAFDTGPGVALVDAAVELATGGEQTFDRDGCWAALGRVHDDLLTELLAHPFFRRPPPKSTGREQFGRPLVEDLAARLGSADAQAWADLITTLVALTARSISDAYVRWILPLGLDEVVLTGGGAHHPVLRRLLAHELTPVPLRGGEALGLDPDAREAVAFATLAWAHVRGEAGNVPGATGATGPRVLGSYTPGSPAR